MGMISAQSGTWLPERPADPDWSEGERRAIVEAFDPRALPHDFHDNPYPITGFCAAPTRSIAVPTARGS